MISAGLISTRNDHVALVSEDLAREMWGAPRSALGKRVREGWKDPWREMVGVVGDVYDNGVQVKAPAIVYWPAMMDTFWGDPVHVSRGGVFVIRTNRAATRSFPAEARRAIWSANGIVPIFLVRTLKHVYGKSLARTCSNAFFKKSHLHRELADLALQISDTL